MHHLSCDVFRGRVSCCIRVADLVQEGQESHVACRGQHQPILRCAATADSCDGERQQRLPQSHTDRHMAT